MMTKLNCKVDGDSVAITRQSIENLLAYLSDQLDKANNTESMTSLAALIAGRRMMLFDILDEFK